METVFQLFASSFTNGGATLERDLAPLPRVLRILVIDDGLPPPLDILGSPIHLEEDLSGVPFMGPDWLTAFKLMTQMNL
jgi:hypothetical protein